MIFMRIGLINFMAIFFLLFTFFVLQNKYLHFFLFDQVTKATLFRLSFSATTNTTLAQPHPVMGLPVHLDKELNLLISIINLNAQRNKGFALKETRRLKESHPEKMEVENGIDMIIVSSYLA